MNWIKKSIRSKIVMTVFVCIIVFAAIACPSILLTIRGIHTRHMESQAQNVQRGGENAIRLQEALVQERLALAAQDQSFADAVASGAYAQAEQRMAQLLTFNHLDFMALALPDQSLLASTLPDLADWGLADQAALLQLAGQGKTAAGVESLGGHMLAVMSAQPVYDAQGQIKAVVLGGMDLSKPGITSQMNQVYHVDSAIYHAGKIWSSTPLQGSPLPGGTLPSQVESQVLAGESYVGKQRFDHTTIQGVYLPLVDSRGQVQAVFYNGIDRTGDDRMVTIFIVALLGGICVLCVIALWMIDLVVKGVSNRVNRMVQSAEEISAGDMSAEIQVDGADEVARLGQAFYDMMEGIRSQVGVVEQMAQGDFSVAIPVRGDKDIMGQSLAKLADNLNTMLAGIARTTHQVTTGSHKISDGSRDLVDSSQRQGQAVQSLSLSIQDISQLIQENDRMMEQAAAQIGEIQNMARVGAEKMSQMTGAVADIDKANQQILSIMKVIEDIAFQTNILALNAAVEAARAGQNGKGFAVVAEEVRNLAAKSAQAAQETGVCIADSVDKTGVGTQLADQTAAFFDQIVNGVEESNDIIRKASEQAQAQAGLMEAISQSVNHVSAAVGQNAAIADESALSSQQMKQQADMLQQMIVQFKGQPLSLPERGR